MRGDRVTIAANCKETHQTRLDWLARATERGRDSVRVTAKRGRSSATERVGSASAGRDRAQATCSRARDDRRGMQGQQARHSNKPNVSTAPPRPRLNPDRATVQLAWSLYNPDEGGTRGEAGERERARETETERRVRRELTERAC